MYSLEPIYFEVETERALFARPDSTGCMIKTFNVPTPTAIEGLCSSIAGVHFKKQSFMQAYDVKVCSTIRTDMEKFNSYAICRKPELIAKGAPQQISRIFLVNQKWQFGVKAVSNLNFRHALALSKMFERYVKKGKHLDNVCCGHEDMFPTYVGPIREDTKINTDYTEAISDFTIQVWDKPFYGEFQPFYAPVALVKAGYLNYENLRKENDVF